MLRERRRRRWRGRSGGGRGVARRSGPAHEGGRAGSRSIPVPTRGSAGAADPEQSCPPQQSRGWPARPAAARTSSRQASGPSGHGPRNGVWRRRFRCPVSTTRAMTRVALGSTDDRPDGDGVATLRDLARRPAAPWIPAAARRCPIQPEWCDPDRPDPVRPRPVGRNDSVARRHHLRGTIRYQRRVTGSTSGTLFRGDPSAEDSSSGGWRTWRCGPAPVRTGGRRPDRIESSRACRRPGHRKPPDVAKALTEPGVDPATRRRSARGDSAQLHQSDRSPIRQTVVHR